MEINKPMIKTLRILSEKKYSIEELSKLLKLSSKWIYKIIKKLEKLNFIKKIKEDNTQFIDLSDTSFSQTFKEMIHSKPYVKFEEFLYGLNFRILNSCVMEKKTTQNIAEKLKTSVKSIQNRISNLKSRGLLMESKRFLLINNLAWPVLNRFLHEYRMFSKIKGKIIWKFEDEVLYESDTEKKGIKTGFSAYVNYGIRVDENIFCYYLPEKKLNIEEIFIHSLMQIEDPRELALAITFYFKHKKLLNNKKLFKLSIKYDNKGKFTEFISVLNALKMGAKRTFNLTLPDITKTELEDTLELYNVKEKLHT